MDTQYEFLSGGNTLDESINGVLLAIDWENIRRGAQLYQRSVTPQTLYDAMKHVGEVFGEVRGGKAFGDWGLRPDDGAAFSETGIQPYQAPRTMAGKDRSDPAMLLEVYDWLRDRDDCGVIVLGSGDSDFQILVDRARDMGRRIVLCAFSQSVARDMLAVAPLFPLEAELGIQLSEHGDIPVQEHQEAMLQDVLHLFIREMGKLESRMNFVGYNMLCNQWMLDWGIAWNEFECRRLIDQWMYEEIIERHDVYNPNNPQFPTSAIRLVRANELVREVLGLSRASVSNPVMASETAETIYQPE